MNFDFGEGQDVSNNDVNLDNEVSNEENKTNLDTGNIENNNVDNISNNEISNNSSENNNNDTGNNDKDKVQDTEKRELVPGSIIEIADKKYTIDDNGNMLDESGNIFKEAKDVDNYLDEFDEIDDNNDINIDNIQKQLGVSIVDENDQPVTFENNVEGITNYINAVIENSKQEHYETAINTLYERYPILSDVLDYYIANGNSLKGFGEIPDRSNIIIDETNEAQQEAIIRSAWEEQGRKGNVENYIQYLKSSGTLFTTAKEELAGLQESDKQYREQLAEEAREKEEENIKKLEKYWDGVHNVIKSRTIAGYKIPENIIINRDGRKISATPEDFFNWIYRVDENGLSAYQKALNNETPESRRDDEILRAYLKFVGGNYSNLVNMAINKENVNNLRLKAKEKTNSVRITKPKIDNKKNKEIEFGY